MKVTILSTFLVAFSSLAPSAQGYKSSVHYPDLSVTIYESKPDQSTSEDNDRISWEDGKRTNTLYSFSLEKGLGGKTCKLGWGGQTVKGNLTVDVWSVTGVDKRSTWRYRPVRLQRWGSFDAKNEKEGFDAKNEKEATWNPGRPTFQCPDTAGKVEFELTPTFDKYMFTHTDYNLEGLYVEII